MLCMGKHAAFAVFSMLPERKALPAMDHALSDFLNDYHRGTSIRAYQFLGCHHMGHDDSEGYVFRVWAPNAQSISVVGDFNFWNADDLPMVKISQGVWEARSPYAREGQAYKFLVRHWTGNAVYKADPVGFRSCRAPDTSSVICGPDRFIWQDRQWLARSRGISPLHAPINIYELHLGSWRRKAGGGCYSYSELAPILADYVRSMGYTHVELMPISEYPYGPSWGYQATHFFAPTSRFGAPEELKLLVDTLHRAGIGVILDWLCADFPRDECGLYEFDGTCTYEVADPIMARHPEWSTQLFDYSKPEVRSFLISNAVYWLEEFHMDGLRVGSTDVMLLHDFGRTAYTPNRYGGHENLDAIRFLRRLNEVCAQVRENVIIAAEDPQRFPMVTQPDFDGGLGFRFKWSSRWVTDVLDYMREEPASRKSRHSVITGSIDHAFSDNYILPLSHDAVVHGKGSLIGRMPGEYDMKFANLRLLRGFQMVCPGKKLSFMGSEFGQFIEWNFRQELDWLLLEYDMHQKMQAYTRELNRFYLNHPELWSDDHSPNGFAWILSGDPNGVLAFRRFDRSRRELVCVLNFSPHTREGLRLGVPQPGIYAPVFCSDEIRYGGSGFAVAPGVSEAIPWEDSPASCAFTVPPLSLTVFSRKNC